MHFLRVLVAVAAVAFSIGCNGEISDPGVAPGVTPGPEGPGVIPGPGPDDALPAPLGHTSIRLLNPREYAATVEDLFGVTSDEALSIVTHLPPSAVSGSGFDTDGVVQPLQLEDAEAYFNAAEALAETLEGRDIEGFEGCRGSADLGACFGAAAPAYLHRAFRRPVSESSVTRLRGLLAEAADYDDATAMVAIFTGSSPQFLFHYKSPAPEDGAHELDAYDIADRLSYLLWSSAPDEALLAAAEEGALRDAAIRVQHAERMLADPRSERFYRSFTRLWLRVDGLPSRAITDEDVALYADMATETHAFVERVLSDGRLEDLVLGRESYINGRLAELYGIDVAGDEFRWTTLPPERQGLLTQASVLFAHSPESVSDPIRRGVWVANEFLCSPLRGLAPPTGIPSLGDSFEEGMTPREVLVVHTSDNVCAGCHRTFDPYGLALETFDVEGRYRESYESGRDVDPSGELPSGETFDTILDVNQIIASGDDLERCMAEHLGAYGLGRALNAGELKWLEDITVGGESFGDLVLALIESPLFIQSGGVL